MIQVIIQDLKKEDILKFLVKKTPKTQGWI